MMSEVHSDSVPSLAAETGADLTGPVYSRSMPQLQPRPRDHTRPAAAGRYRVTQMIMACHCHDHRPGMTQ
eukprot:433868-Hanusia_phi.AAC.1